MTESALPGNVGTGTVTGKFVTAQKGTGGTPVTVPIVGSVTFTPTPAALLDVAASPPTTILPVPVTATLDAAGSFSVDLVATDDADLNPTGWNYRVSFAFTGTKYTSFNINVPEGSTVDLATVAPVASAGGTLITRGIGVPDTSGATTGQVLAVASDGSTHWIDQTGGSGGTVTSDSITDATTVGKALLVAVDAPTARDAIGAASAAQGALANSALQPGDVGTAAVAASTDFATAAQGAKADTAVQPAALTSLAPLASPALTGTPTAPTATAGNNSTQLANTAFVAAAIAALINSAPGALDTLKELADAIGDDANFAATVTNALALKAPLASPTFTGTVSGITAAMVGAATSAQGTKADSAVQPASLATVATSGSAADLSTGLLAIARLPAKSVIVQAFTSANYASLARPTSRTDVTVFWVGDDSTSSSTQPTNRIAGDLVATKQA